jgi:hypothetical protein
VSDFRTMFDSIHIGAWDLPPTGATVIIESVKAGKIKGAKGKEDRKPIVSFRGKKKTMVFNKTNCKIVAAMYGTDTANWEGKAITIFSTTTDFGGTTVECIRVKPIIPQAPNNTRGGTTELADGSVDAETDEEREAIEGDA